MLLFQKRFHAGLVSGAVTVTLRRWDKPHVKVGGRYRCHPIGVLEVDAITRMKLRDVPDADALLSGFVSRAEMIEYLKKAPGGALRPTSLVWRVTLHHGGDGDRVTIATDTALAPADVAAITKRLAKLDGHEKWTAKTFAMIDRHPRVAASQLAKKLGARRSRSRSTSAS